MLCTCDFCTKIRKGNLAELNAEEFKMLQERKAQNTAMAMEKEDRLNQQGYSENHSEANNDTTSCGFFDLGFMQAHTSMPKVQFFEEYVFSSNTKAKDINNIYSLNAHLNDPIRKGEIIIIAEGEATNDSEQKQLQCLTEQCVAASKALAELSEVENNLLHQHLFLFDELISEYLLEAKLQGWPTDKFAQASVGVGSLATGSKTHLEGIHATLQQIEKLYVEKVAKPASKGQQINYPKFHSERSVLFSKLDNHVSKLTMKSLNIPIQTKLKNTLKLSTKSVIHNADEIVKGKSIPDFGKRIANISGALKGTEKIGYVGIALGAMSAGSNIYDACKTNGTSECGKKTIAEVTGLFAGILAGGVAGKVGVTVGGVALVMIGVTSAPVIAIGVATSAAIGGALGGAYASGFGKMLAEKLYETAGELF
ncbi:hypothetical protein [Vibrio sp. TRT 1302]|uniref:hypothetical protein n=1 Tax=Vibrio sp. TRT 1302 TaxID=3418504 RepID=UPI003CF3FF25